MNKNICTYYKLIYIFILYISARNYIRNKKLLLLETFTLISTLKTFINNLLNDNIQKATI